MDATKIYGYCSTNLNIFIIMGTADRLTAGQLILSLNYYHYFKQTMKISMFQIAPESSNSEVRGNVTVTAIAAT